MCCGCTAMVAAGRGPDGTPRSRGVHRLSPADHQRSCGDKQDIVLNRQHQRTSRFSVCIDTAAALSAVDSCLRRGGGRYFQIARQFYYVFLLCNFETLSEFCKLGSTILLKTEGWLRLMGCFEKAAGELRLLRR